MKKPKNKKRSIQSQNFGEVVGSTMAMSWAGDIAVLPDQKSLQRLLLFLSALVLVLLASFLLTRSSGLVTSTRSGTMVLSGAQASDANLQSTEPSSAFQTSNNTVQQPDMGTSAQNTAAAGDLQGSTGIDSVQR